MKSLCKHIQVATVNGRVVSVTTHGVQQKRQADCRGRSDMAFGGTSPVLENRDACRKRAATDSTGSSRLLLGKTRCHSVRMTTLCPAMPVPVPALESSIRRTQETVKAQHIRSTRASLCEASCMKEVHHGGPPCKLRGPRYFLISDYRAGSTEADPKMAGHFGRYTFCDV